MELQIKLLQSGAGVITKWGRFCYYKVGQNLSQSVAAFLLQSGAILLQSGAGITKRSNFITKWGRYYKVGHNTCFCQYNLTELHRNVILLGTKKSKEAEL